LPLERLEGRKLNDLFVERTPFILEVQLQEKGGWPPSICESNRTSFSVARIDPAMGEIIFAENFVAFIRLIFLRHCFEQNCPKNHLLAGLSDDRRP